MPGVELASAYISLIPSAKGIGNKIATEIGAPVEKAARDAGDRASTGFAESFKKKTASLGSTFAKIGATATLGLTVPIIAGGKQLIDAASSTAESLSKAKVVFKDEVGAIERLAANSAKTLGISSQKVLEATGTFGNLFVALKIGQKPAAEMSTRLVALAADLASFNNVSPEDALEALRAGIVGETEPLRKFGVNLNEATLKAKAMELGLSDGKGTLDAAAKAQAAYAIILEQTAVAQGDFARTSEGAANKQRIIAAQFENAKATLGQALLPLFLQIASVVSSLAERFGKLSPQVQKVILVIAGVLAIAGPLAAAIGGIITIVGLVASPVGLIVAAIAALAAGLIYAYTHVKAFRDIVNGVAQIVAEFVLPRLQLLVELFRTKIIPALQEAARIIAEYLQPKIDELRAAFERNRPEIEKVAAVVGRLIEQFLKAYAAVAEFLLPVLGRVAGIIGGQLISNVTGAVELVGKLVRGFETLADVGERAGGVLSRLPIVGGNGGFKIPGFATGGIVPGPPGAPTLAVVHGGEQVLTRAQQSEAGGGGAPVTVNMIAPHNAGVAAQAELAARAVSWRLGARGRR